MENLTIILQSGDWLNLGNNRKAIYFVADVSTLLSLSSGFKTFDLPYKPYKNKYFIVNTVNK